MSKLIQLCALCVGIIFVTAASAQNYPARTVTIIVATNPGGTTDALGRLLAKHFGEAWGQTVVVENKPGANNQIGIEYAARAKPDGHTLLVALDSFVTGPILAKKPSYSETLMPVSGLVRAHHALFAHPSVPAGNVAELIKLAKNKPGQLNYGTPGLGSGAHLSMEYLQNLAGIKLTAVHYRGAVPALTDVVAGHIQLMFMDLGTVIGQSNAGKVKLLGVGAGGRLAELPDLPILNETLQGFTAGAWWGLFAPRGTPNEVVAKINTEVQKIFAQPAIREQFIKPQNLEPFTGTSAALGDFVNSERAKWEKVIRDANVSAGSSAK